MRNLGLSETVPTAEADKVIDALIGSDPKNPDFLIARYNYRRRYKVVENAREDLESILVHQPDHVEALLLLADEDASTGNEKSRLAAEKRLLKVIELRPDDPRGYIICRAVANEGGQSTASPRRITTRTLQAKVT